MNMVFLPGSKVRDLSGRVLWNFFSFYSLLMTVYRVSYRHATRSVIWRFKRSATQFR